MKFKFKIQKYQTEAVERTVDVFAGQPGKGHVQYRRDLGKRKGQLQATFEGEDLGFKNGDVELSTMQLLNNIQAQQLLGDIPQSKSISQPDGLGACALDIEMETGTGKTYVYIKTMFELNRRYGWSKFIVVVPSIAIREGVYKSFKMLEDHFMELYKKKARYFIYNSSNLQELDSYSSDANINVMIVNVQAFARDMKEGANNKVSLIMYSKRDEFQSRKPIDVISANRPIIIMDEPQKMEGQATQTALKRFKPLFVLNYSATHRTQHNCVYALDAYDAYRQRLVKKIQVKGITLKNLRGNTAYMYFDGIILSKTKAPEVRLEIEVKTATGMKRRIIKFQHGDSLQDASGLAAYAGFTITEIVPQTNTVFFQNGQHIRKGEVIGDATEEQI